MLNGADKSPEPAQSPKKKAGCFPIGCASIIGLILVVAVINAFSSGNRSNAPSSSAPAHLTASQKAAQRKHDEAVAYARTVSGMCKKWGALLRSAGGGAIVASYECRGANGGPYSIHATIRDEAWTVLDYDQRLRLAKSLWEGCVKAAALYENADSCHVKLYGEAGESLGGSNDFAGSMIDVTKD